MGAVVGKAVEDFAGAPVRLAVAEHAVLRWSGSSGADAGVWDVDAAATCSGRSFLSAIDEILLLKETQAFAMVSPARRRTETALGVAMSRLMEEFLRLRVWDASPLQGGAASRLRFAVENLSTSVAPSGDASLAFPTGGGGAATTGELSLASSDELYASGGSRTSRPDTVSVDIKFLDELDLICPASLPVLHEMALRVIRAGHTRDLLRTFNKAPCDVLDRFLAILQVDGSLEADRVSFEDAEWWGVEDMVRRWILAAKLVSKALAAMQRQLQAQSCGAFDGFKDEYYSMAIAKRGIFGLLRFADGFTSIHSHEKLIYVLEVYEALSDAAPGLLLVLTGQHAELVSRQVAVVLAKLARASRVAVGGLVAMIRTDRSPADWDVGVGVGVHPLTRHAMNCVELLAPHRDALDVILANGVGVTSFRCVVSKLIAGLEHNLEEKAAVASADGSPAQAHLFLANNTSFVSKRSLLGDEWAARRRGLLERHAASYVEASWGPVVACLPETAGVAGRPARALARFESAFERAYSGQACCEVADPALRADLRKAVSETVVPAYAAFLRRHPKIERHARRTAGDLAESLLELFEGETTGRKKF
ncbi:hypothetical protein ACP4OV_029827 [Aristida adscensionis]